jgi:hypothetical protein
MGARVIETEFYRVVFIETESRTCTPFVYTVRVDRSRYNDAYVRMTCIKDVPVDRQPTVAIDTPAIRLLFVSCHRLVATQGEGYERVYHYNTPSPVITFIFLYIYIDLATSCLIAAGKTDVSTESRYIPFSRVFFSRRSRYDVLFDSSFRVYDYSGRFGIAFV